MSTPKAAAKSSRVAPDYEDDAKKQLVAMALQLAVGGTVSEPRLLQPTKDAEGQSVVDLRPEVERLGHRPDAGGHR